MEWTPERIWLILAWVVILGCVVRSVTRRWNR